LRRVNDLAAGVAPGPLNLPYERVTMTEAPRVKRKYVKSGAPRKPRTPNRFKYEAAIKRIFDLFVCKFLQQVTLQEEESRVKQGIRAFFAADVRIVSFCKATEAFKMPGRTWRSLEEPNVHVAGVGRRHVPKGAALTVRLDERMPDRCEVEWDAQVFVMSQAEWLMVKEKLKPIA
jgi:hypothetical protein